MPDDVKAVVPHLVVDDAAAALEFYKKGLGAEEVMRLPAEDGRRLMHAEIRIGQALAFVRDDFPERCTNSAVGSAKRIGGTPVTLHLEVADCDAAVARAAAAGAMVTLAPMDAFWGARYGQIMDPFGHSWSFAHPLPEGEETVKDRSHEPA